MSDQWPRKCATAGSAAGTGLKDAQPQRWIHLDTFDIDRNEVTVAQYQRCVQARKCVPAKCMKASFKLETRPNHKATCRLANFRGCQQPNSSMPVGSLSKGASPFGVLDMAGNVHEWVADWHSGSYYATGPVRNPVGPARGTDKIVRGGSFVYGADELNTQWPHVHRTTQEHC